MPESTPLPHAGVHFPPPLVYAGGLAAGWLLNRWWRAPITTGPSGLRVALGALGVLAWLALFLGALAAFRRSRTTIVPNQPATAIVTEGPYRFTRNPMYVSLVTLYLGLTLLLNTWWPLLFLPAVVAIIQTRVIAREERYLESAFPAAYGAYAGRVRRWL